MSDRRRVLILVMIMLIVALVVTGVSITLLYRAAFNEEKDRLVEAAQSQARLIESVARFATIYSKEYLGGPLAATLDQISDAHANYSGFGQTGEFTLARREDDLIVFLLRHRHFDTDLPQPVPFSSELAEPMRRALSGQSGTVVGLDYRGETVLAAYEPVAELNMGIVAKIDLVEIQAPFIRAGIIAGVVTLLVVILGALLFLRITEPLLRNIRGSEERLRSFMEAATESFFLFDKGLNCLMINKVGMGFFPPETRPEDLIGKDILDIVPSLKESGRYDQYKKVIETGEPFSADDVVPDSKLGEVYLSIRAFKVGDGLGMLISDITERKQAERALRENEIKFRVIFENSVDAIGVSKSGIHSFVNSAYLALFGYADMDELTGKPILDLIAPSEHGKILDNIQRRAKGENIPAMYETRGLQKDGSEFDMDVHVATYGLNEENHTLVIMRDITEKKQAERALRESEEKTRKVLDTAVFPVAVVDTQDEKIFYWSKSAYNLFGHTASTTDAWYKLAYPDPEYRQQVIESWKPVVEKALKLKKTVMAGEYQVTCKDGSVRICELYVSFVAENLIITFDDITERKQREEEKQQIEVHLRQQQKLESIGTLASGVAHEINNPIMGIMNYATLISERLDPSQNQLREFADEIGHETERVATIVNNLLTFSRQDKQSHSPARITDIVDGTLSLIRTVIKRDQITLEVDVPDDLPEFKCRSQQIQQVLMNLLTNARDALNARYPEYDPKKIINMSVRLFEKEGRRWLRTTVEDHGVGIPVEIRERIFDPFYTTKDRAIGTGLGLSISLGIVKDHHGELSFESEEGQPTRFYLDLPVDNGWDL